MSLFPDVSMLTIDESLGAQSFTIIRIGGEWREGKFIESEERISAFGNIQPATEQQINQVPEGDRTSGMLSLWTITPLRMTNQKEPYQKSDVIEWEGNRYKIASMMPWNQFGFNIATLAKVGSV